MFAGELDLEISAAEVKQKFQLRARQCVFFMYALSFYRYGPIDYDDVLDMCCLMTMIKSVMVFEDPTDYDAVMEAMSGRGVNFPQPLTADL